MMNMRMEKIRESEALLEKVKNASVVVEKDITKDEQFILVDSVMSIASEIDITTTSDLRVFFRLLLAYSIHRFGKQFARDNLSVYYSDEDIKKIGYHICNDYTHFSKPLKFVDPDTIERYQWLCSRIEKHYASLENFLSDCVFSYTHYDMISNDHFYRMS